MSSTSFNFTNNITNAPTIFASPSNVGTLGSRSIQIAPGPLLPRANATQRLTKKEPWLTDRQVGRLAYKDLECKGMLPTMPTQSQTSQGNQLQPGGILGALYDYTLGVLEPLASLVQEEAKVEPAKSKPKAEPKQVAKAETIYKTTKQLVDYVKTDFICTDQFQNDCVGSSKVSLKGTLILIGNDHSDTEGLATIKKFLKEHMSPGDVFLAETTPDDLNPAVCFGVPQQQCIGIGVGHSPLSVKYHNALIDATYERLEAFDPDAARSIKAWLPNLDSDSEYERLLNEAMENVRPRIPSNKRAKLRKLDEKVQKASDNVEAEIKRQVPESDRIYRSRINEQWSRSKDRAVFCSLGLMHVAKIGLKMVGEGVFMLLPRTSLPDWVESDS
jgi:hypothetical protein